MKTMKYEVIKNSIGYVVVITREDGTTNDYRFTNKRQMNQWMKLAGLN